VDECKPLTTGNGWVNLFHEQAVVVMGMEVSRGPSSTCSSRAKHPDYILSTSNLASNRPISTYRFPRRALTLCPQLYMGIRPGARFLAWSADALPTTRPIMTRSLKSNQLETTGT
jgi:hypothetical protein